MPFTLFWDMYSGGGCKEKPYDKIIIEAPEQEAKIIFYNRFGHNPERVTCTCCGEDYSIREAPTLEQLTAFHRGCAWDKASHGYIEKVDPRKEKYGGKLVSLRQYLKQPNVLFIPADQIKPEERVGKVPVQGYIWH